MTIKELEERTGMTRANIRFYESEGLIAPKRLANGYRDYSEEDARTLQKILLLRQLHLELETIRLVQRGELTLEQALFVQLNRLEGEQAAAGRAAEVCRRLERSGADYGSLDPGPWLRELEAPQRSRVEPPAQSAPIVYTPAGELACDHPWLRLLARTLDTALYGLAVNAVLLLVCHWWYVRDGALAQWFAGLLSLALSLLCEPFWLRLWGWTPGKWLFGLKLRDGDGEKLSLAQGFHRAKGVFCYGYGGTIPILNQWRFWKSWKCCRDRTDCPWDEEEEYQYTYQRRKWAWLGWAAGWAAVIGLTAVILLQSFLPPNRGELTAAEFCKNFNFYLDYLGVDDVKRVDESGRWVDPSQQGVVFIRLGGAEQHDLDLRVEDGFVTAVTLSESDDPNGLFIFQSQICCQAATLALAGADRGVNCFTFHLKDWLALWDGRWNDFDLEWRGLSICQRVECSGYQSDGPVRTPWNGEKHSFFRSVTIGRLSDEPAGV